jgi:hypothetical protein
MTAAVTAAAVTTATGASTGRRREGAGEQNEGERGTESHGWPRRLLRIDRGSRGHLAGCG